MTPSESEIRRAKEYLSLRLKAQRIIVSELDSALLLAARQIVYISREYGIPPESFRFSANPKLQREVRAVLAALREALYNRVRSIVTFVDGEDYDNPFVAPILTARDNGKILKERLAMYTTRWGYELEATIAAAGLEKITDTQTIIDGVRDYLSRPYDNPWIKNQTKNGVAVRLGAIPRYGRGTRIAAEAALALLLSMTIAKGWMQNWARINSDKLGFYVYRGSSYPCEICQSQVGFLHDISDTEGLPPLHPNCCCITVYTDEL